MKGLILLTGATGFVGLHVLNMLENQGFQVRLIVREGKQGLFADRSNVESIVSTSDLFSESEEWWESACLGIDTIIHVAWYVQHDDFLRSPKNIDCLAGTLRIARGALNAKVRRFAGVGTCYEYDCSARNLSIDTPLAPQSLYASTKAAAYFTLSHWLQEEGVDFVWNRLFFLYGEGEDSRRLVPFLREKLSSGQEVALTRGTQIRDYLEVREAARLIVDASLGVDQGAFNICSGVPVSIRALSERIADEYGGRDLLRFGARSENAFDPPYIVGVRRGIES